MAASKDDAKAADGRLAWLEARVRETYKHVKVRTCSSSAEPGCLGAVACRRGPARSAAGTGGLSCAAAPVRWPVLDPLAPPAFPPATPQPDVITKTFSDPETL